MLTVAVTGASGRLGRAIIRALVDRGFPAVAWSRPLYDLDDPSAPETAFDRDQPEVVVHCAAWTDVDWCARAPDLAMRRNADAVAELASTCASNGTRLVLVSTNEVFDGERTDGHGYSEDDVARPINAYGRSKLAGEDAARQAFDRAGASDNLLIARTAWLFGPPGNDFPGKIIAAADRLPAGQPLKVVGDEVGSPTYSIDLAEAIVRLGVELAAGGTYHLVNEGKASRLEVAARVLSYCRPDQATAAISRTEFVRPSTPPAWAVLENTRGVGLGVSLRPWQAAIDAYAPSLCPA